MCDGCLICGCSLPELESGSWTGLCYSLILFEKKWHWPGQTESQELLTIALTFESTLIGCLHRLYNNIFIIIKSMDTKNITKCLQPGQCSLQKLNMNVEYSCVNKFVRHHHQFVIHR
mgnify:FL=1